MADVLVIPKDMQPTDPMAQGTSAPSTIVVPKSAQPQQPSRLDKVRKSFRKNVISNIGSPEAEGATFPPSIQPLVNGFNQRFLELFGIPLDVTNKIWTDLGNEGFLDTDETGTEALTRKLNEIGIPAKAVETEAERIGYQLFDNLAVAAVTMGTGNLINAGVKLTGPATSNIGRAGQQITQTAAAHPTVTLLSEAGSAVGQHTLGPALAPTIGEEPGEMVGAIAGGMTPDTVTSRALARLGGGVVGGTVGFAGGALSGHPAIAIAGGAVGAMRGARSGRNMIDKLLAERLEPQKAFMTMDSPDEAIEYARQAVNGDIVSADAAITRAVQNVGGIADPTRRAERLHGIVDGLYKRAQANATKLWNRVDQSRPVRTAIPELKSFADQMRAEAGEFNEGLPDRFLGYIDEIASSLGAGKAVDTKMAPDGSVEIIRTPGHVFSIKDLRNIQESIGADLRAGVHNATLKRNLTLLNDAIDTAVQKVYPNDGTLATAREYTKWLHSTFSEGALGSFYGRGAPKGAFLSAPQDKALKLLESERGGAQLADAAKALRSKKVETGLTQFVAAEFQKRADDLGPEKGLKFLQAPGTQRFLVNFPREGARMERVATDLDVALKNRKAIEDSYFYRFAGMDPQSAAERSLSGPKKVQNVQAIVSRLSEDETGRALEGYRGAVLRHTLGVVKNDPARFQMLLGDKDMRAAFSVIFGEKMPRLDSLLKDLAKYGGNKGDLATAKVDEVVGGVSGAILGRQVPDSGLIGPSMGSNIARWATKQIFGRPSASELIHLALQNPRWEAYVKAKVPTNLTEMRAATDEMTRLLAMSQGAIVAFGGATE